MAKTIQQIQAMITGKSDAREVINEIADYLEANPGGTGGVQSIIAGTNITLGGTAADPVINASGGSSYLSYVALLTQTGTSAPVATVLANTLGGTVVWTRDSAGNYTGTLAGAFTEDKTYFPPFGDFSGDANPYIPIWAGSGAIIGYYTLFLNAPDSIGMQVKNTSGVSVDLFDLIATTTLMLPEIKVFP
jgi:hypothetical protein